MRHWLRKADWHPTKMGGAWCYYLGGRKRCIRCAVHRFIKHFA